MKKKVVKKRNVKEVVILKKAEKKEEKKPELEKNIDGLMKEAGLRSEKDSKRIEDNRQSERVAPVLKTVARSARENLDVLAEGGEGNREKRNESVEYSSRQNTNYVGGTYVSANRRGGNSSRRNLVQPAREIKPEDFLARDERIGNRPIVLTRKESEEIFSAAEQYEKYERKLPFEKDEKKYRNKR